MLARDARTYDNKPFELHAEHLFAQAVNYPVFGPQVIDHPLQGGRAHFGEFEPQHFGTAVEKQPAARHLAVMTEDAVEIAVESKDQVFALGARHVEGMERRQGQQHPSPELHGNMVDFEPKASTPYPDEFIEPGAAMQRGSAVVAAQDEVAFQGRAECQIHGSEI